MTYNRPEVAAEALPFIILPAHACTTSAGWKRRKVPGEHDVSGRVGTCRFGIAQPCVFLVQCQ